MTRKRELQRMRFRFYREIEWEDTSKARIA